MDGKKKKTGTLKQQRRKAGLRSKSSKSVITNMHIYSTKKPKRLGKTCIYFDSSKLTCKLSKLLCSSADSCTSYRTDLKEVQSDVKNINIVDITTIVLSDNRKCTNNEHNIIDISAKLRIAKPNGDILMYSIPAAYCKECDTYFVLKKDYKTAKLNGKILCPVIDMTWKGEKSNKGKTLSCSESRIHQLGYNVKRGSNYTIEQRRLILANIIENTNISRHEIESCITRSIMQHKNQPNYADAVSAWMQDLEFVQNYKDGDMMEVVIDKMIIGRRKLRRENYKDESRERKI